MWNASNARTYTHRNGRFYRKGLHKAQNRFTTHKRTRSTLCRTLYWPLHIYMHDVGHFHNFQPMKSIDICGCPMEINWTHKMLFIACKIHSYYVRWSGMWMTSGYDLMMSASACAAGFLGFYFHQFYNVKIRAQGHREGEQSPPLNST